MPLKLQIFLRLWVQATRESSWQLLSSSTLKYKTTPHKYMYGEMITYQIQLLIYQTFFIRQERHGFSFFARVAHLDY